MGILGRKSKLSEEAEVNTGTPDKAALLKYIANLKTSDIDKLVSIAKNQYNESPEKLSKSMSDYFDLLKEVFGNSSTFNSIGNTPNTRNQRYEVYDEMDESTAYISSALDILSDDATQADEDGVIIHIKSDSEKIQNIVTDFIVEHELEDKVSKWARAIAKYGDLFIKVEGDYNKGVISINDTIYPGMIDRRDMNGKLVAFTNNQNTVYSNDDLYAPWEFVHFRHKGDIYKEESSYARLGISRDTYDKSLTSAYGQSVLRPAIKVYAQLRFVENMLLLSRLTNSIRRNIFLINVGEVEPGKAFETIANYANLLKKDINLNLEDNIYSASKHTIKYDEDIFIPIGDPQNDVRIESVGGDVNIREQYDLEYLLNKLFSALKIPKAYLNYEQDLNARATLVQLDIRYARGVGQLQNTIASGLRRLINIHLAYLGLDPNEVDLEVSLTSVSAIDAETRVTQQQSQVNVARDMWDLVVSMREGLGESSESIDLEQVAETIMQDYLELDRGIIDKVLNKKTPMQKIRSHKSYSITDGHAMYPSEANNTAYERIRESIIHPENPKGDNNK